MYNVAEGITEQLRREIFGTPIFIIDIDSQENYPLRPLTAAKACFL
jgi:hypothetical protein